MSRLVLLDLDLPRDSGIEVLRRIRGNDRTNLLPVVILTSTTLDEDYVSSYGLGPNTYVRKPVDFDAFVEAARLLGLFWSRSTTRSCGHDAVWGMCFLRSSIRYGVLMLKAATIGSTFPTTSKPGRSSHDASVDSSALRCPQHTCLHIRG